MKEGLWSTEVAVVTVSFLLWRIGSALHSIAFALRRIADAAEGQKPRVPFSIPLEP